MTIKETTAAWAAGLLRTWDAVLEVFGLVRLGKYRRREGELYAVLSEACVELGRRRRACIARKIEANAVRADLFKAEEELRELRRYVAPKRNPSYPPFAFVGGFDEEKQP